MGIDAGGPVPSRGNPVHAGPGRAQSDAVGEVFRKIEDHLPDGRGHRRPHRGRDGHPAVGEEALNQLVLHPDRTVRSVKRLMGSAETVPMAGKRYRPQEISAMILSALNDRAERVLGEAVAGAVITVPAYFSDAQRQATREAGEIAGLAAVRILNEPTAASLAHGEQAHGRTVLVYDLGGGTFDVSVVRIEEGINEVLSSHGDPSGIGFPPDPI
jgi:molecular chaperone DnaK